MQTQSASASAQLLYEAKAYWDKYLWHHRHPWTRRLHRLGSWLCIAGAGASLAGYGVHWFVLAMISGYFCAFAGHWWVEENRPLTFENPLRAGIANWVMFVFEMVGDVEGALEKLASDAPDCDGMGSQ